MDSSVRAAATLEPVEADIGPKMGAPVAEIALEQPDAVPPSSASSEVEIAPLRGSQDGREAPSTRPSGSRSPSASRGRVTTKTSSPGFVRFQIRTARAPRPRLSQNTRKLPLTWLVVRVVKSQRIGGQPRQRLVQHLGSIRRDDINLPGARRRFWAGADARLAGFSPEIRYQFEDAIATRISRPPDRDPGLSLAEKLAAARLRMLAARTTKEPTTT